LSDTIEEHKEEDFDNLQSELKKKSKLIRQQNKKFRKAGTIVTQYKEYEKLQKILKEWDVLATKMKTIKKNFPVK